ncbi:MAG TPA: type I-B CRISPR-associated endonuclease Cas1b [Saprospiraceae bacterium]|nr:type I-B CRISPR-associated endonuclease Cas1b [Saprospiraceae bacterium]
MKKTYYLFNDGRMSRKDNTLCFVARDKDGKEQPAKYLPIETVETMYVFGSLDLNSALLNYLGQKQIVFHFFDYYEHYTGSFMPKDYLLAGKMQIEQTRAYLNHKRRLPIAKSFIEAAVFNMRKNLKYYDHRGRDMEPLIERLDTYNSQIEKTQTVDELMGIEGNCRKIYYAAFNLIIQDFVMGHRQKQPPDNEVNALISFGNMLCYSLCLSLIYHTQLNPTISFLHEPGVRRYSLALDIAEIFKPILVDRIIFKVFNKKELQEKHFDKNVNSCVLNKSGKEIFLRNWEEKLGETIKHRSLDRQVSYKHLVKLECYKLQKAILEIETEYQGFKIWW